MESQSDSKYVVVLTEGGLVVVMALVSEQIRSDLVKMVVVVVVEMQGRAMRLLALFLELISSSPWPLEEVAEHQSSVSSDTGFFGETAIRGRISGHQAPYDARKTVLAWPVRGAQLQHRAVGGGVHLLSSSA